LILNYVLAYRKISLAFWFIFSVLHSGCCRFNPAAFISTINLLFCCTEPLYQNQEQSSNAKRMGAQGDWPSAAGGLRLEAKKMKENKK
jgi:hypothetical protein